MSLSRSSFVLVAALLSPACAIKDAASSSSSSSSGGDPSDTSSTQTTASATEKDPGANGDNNSGSSNNGNGGVTKPPRRQAVAFIHGTSDLGDVGDLHCGGQDADWNCVSASAVSDYWTQSNIDSERTDANGARRPYVVVGCPLSAQTPWPNETPVKPEGGPPEPGSAVCVAAEVSTFLDGPDGKTGTADDIDDIVLLTHSGGSNVVRYILQQHSAHPTFERVHGASRGFIGIAAPSHGTYLADRVFQFGALEIGNELFGAGYDDDGVDFIQTTKMDVWNADPAKLVNLDKDVAGVPSFMAAGSFPDTDGDAAKVACGGESETESLHALHELYLDDTDPATYRDGCSDGFITCQSSMALANGDESRVVFGMLGTKAIGSTHYRAHNQSRRDCDGVDIDIRRTVNAILGGTAASAAPAAPVGNGDNNFASAPAALSPYRPRAPFIIAASSAAIVSTTAAAEDGGVLVTIATRAQKKARLGARATLVVENDAGSFVVGEGQTSVDASAGAMTTLTMHLRRSQTTMGKLVIRDLALVSHDDASTLDTRDRIDVVATRSADHQ